MFQITPLPEAEATDKVEQTYGRIKEMLGTETVPDVFLACGRVQPFLQDFYMNFKKFVHSDGKLDATTKAAIALAVSAKEKSQPWMDFFSDRCRQLGLEDQQQAEVVALAAINATYNTFFKFRELSGSDIFEGMPVGLRAHTFTSTSLDDQTAELINIVISDLNVCKPCVTGHLDKARKLGLSDEAILEAIQCTATMEAGIQFLKASG